MNARMREARHDRRRDLMRQPFYDGLVALAITVTTVIVLTRDDRLSLPVILFAIVVGLSIPAYGIVHIFRRQPPFYNLADRVTLFRTILTSGVASLVTISVVSGQSLHVWAVIGLAFTVIVLDGVDGHVARRTGTSTTAGAQFDTDADAILVLVLSVSLAPIIGWWTLLIGLMRYMFLALTRLRPEFDRPMPPSKMRKIIGLGQSVALCVALMPFVPTTIATAIPVIALVFLTWSFGCDILPLEGQSDAARSTGKNGPCYSTLHARKLRRT